MREFQKFKLISWNLCHSPRSLLLHMVLVFTLMKKLRYFDKYNWDIEFRIELRAMDSDHFLKKVVIVIVIKNRNMPYQHENTTST